VLFNVVTGVKESVALTPADAGNVLYVRDPDDAALPNRDNEGKVAKRQIIDLRDLVGFFGLKPLPEDDVVLTTRTYSVYDDDDFAHDDDNFYHEVKPGNAPKQQTSAADRVGDAPQQASS